MFMEFFFLRVLFENRELASFYFVFNFCVEFTPDSYKSMMTVALFECSESLKSNRDTYDIFYVNFITLSSFTIQGA